MEIENNVVKFDKNQSLEDKVKWNFYKVEGR